MAGESQSDGKLVSMSSPYRPLSATQRTLPHRLPRLLTWLVMLLALAVYARRAAPGIVTFFDDTLEFQLVAPTFGIAHPTGYPLYTLLGGLWVHLLPVGTWAGRLNLLNALLAALTLGLLYRLAARLSHDPAGEPSPWAGGAAALAFGLGSVWVGQATVAEVYPLHLLLSVLLLTLAVGLNQSLTADRATPAFDRRMAALCSVVGLGLAHHRTLALTALPVALYLLVSVPGLWRPRRVWLGWLAALLAPLLLYLYIPLRAAAGMRDLHGSYLPTWGGFWEHVLATRYTAFFADNPLTVPVDWPMLLVSQLGWLALGLAALGLLRLVDRRGRPARAWWLVLGVIFVNGGFVQAYRVPDPEVFALPALLGIALLVGGGVDILARHLPPRVAHPWPKVLPPLLGTALLLLLAWLPTGRAPLPDRSRDWAAHDQARRMAQAAFPADSLVLGLEGEMTALRYMQLAEGRGPPANLTTANLATASPTTANDPAQRRALLADALAAERPVYLTRELEETSRVYSFTGDAGLIRVWPRGHAQVAPLPPMPPILLDAGRVQIDGYALRPLDGLARPAQELTIHWRLREPTPRVLKLSLRLLGPDGAPYTWPNGAPAVADVFPLAQAATSPDWLPGELLQDVHTLWLPPAAQTARAQGTRVTLQVIIYDAATVEELHRIEIRF